MVIPNYTGAHLIAPLVHRTPPLFAPNLLGMEWNGLLCNKFALINAQKSPDNCAILFQFSLVTASINSFSGQQAVFSGFESSTDILQLSQVLDYT